MSAYIKWKDSYSVKDPLLDSEHQQIIACINELHDVAQDPNAGEVTKRVLDRLVQYTNTHFAHEEKRLKEVGFPTLEAHKGLHDTMRRRTLDLRTHLTLVTARDVLVFLKDWWLDHIQGEDMSYSSYMMKPVAKAMSVSYGRP